MRRFLPAAVIALLAIVVATPVNAGYLVIRVILEGGVPSPDSSVAGPSGLAMTPGGDGRPGPIGSGGPPMGSGLGPPSGVGVVGSSGGGPPKPGSGSGGGGPGPVAGPSMTSPAATPIPLAFDSTRCVVIVVPVDEDLGANSAFYPKMPFNVNTNPHWKPKLHLTHRGQKLVINLFA